MVKEYIRKLTSEGAIYGLSSSINQIAPMLLIPVYGHLFSPDQLGLISLANSILLLSGAILVFALDSSVARWYWDTSSTEDRKTSLNTWLFFYFSISVLISFFLFLFSDLIAIWLFSGNVYLVELLALILTFRVIGIVLTNWFRMQRKPFHVLVFNFASTFLLLITTLIFVIYLEREINGVFEAQAIALFAASTLGFILLSKFIDIRYFSIDRLTSMLKFSLPLMPAGALGWIMSFSDRWILLKYTNLETVGVYQMAVFVSLASGLLCVAFQQAWGAFALSIHKNEDAKDVYAAVFILFTALSSTIAFLVSLFAQDILLLVSSEKYKEAKFYVAFLSFAHVAGALYYIAAIGCEIARNNVPILISLIYGAMSKILLTFILVPHIGAVGAALSTLLSYMVMAIYLFYATKNLYPVSYNFTLAIILFISFLALGWSGIFISTASAAITFFIKIAIVLIVFGVMYLMYRALNFKFLNNNK